jgi:hypothetical protein
MADVPFFEDQDVDEGTKARIRRMRELMRPYPERADDFCWLMLEAMFVIGHQTGVQEVERLPTRKKLKQKADALARDITRLLNADESLRRESPDLPVVDPLPRAELERIRAQAEAVARAPSPPPRRSEGEVKRLAVAAVKEREFALKQMCPMDDGLWKWKLAAHLAELDPNKRPEIDKTSLRDLMRY